MHDKTNTRNKDSSAWMCNEKVMSTQCTHGYTVYEGMYACTDYDLLIMYKCVNFCEMNIHSFLWVCYRASYDWFTEKWLDFSVNHYSLVV